MTPRSRRYQRFAVAVVLALAMVTAPRVPAQDHTVADFFRNFTDEWVRGNPNQAVAARYFSGPEQDRLAQQLTPATDEWQRGRIRLARQGLAELRKFNRARMTDTERVSADLMERQLNIVVQGEPYLDYSFPLEQFGGVNVGLVSVLTVTHPLLNEKDATNYIARLGHVSTRMEEAIAESQRLIARGLFPPRFILDATLAQMKQFSATPAAQSPFVTTLGGRLAAVTGISDATREGLRAQAERIVDAQVYPVWRKAIALIEPLLNRATNDAGLWRFKGGADAYAYNLRRFTSTTLNADQIHQIGLREVDRIEKEMDAILRRLGRTEGTVKDRIATLREDLKYPITEDGRKLIMTDVEQILRDAEKRAALQFDRRPQTPVVAQPYPRFREANAAASYSAPALDGSRPGTFQIPLRPERMTKFGLRTLVYHETVPGHHFQIAFEMENEALPRFRQIRALGGVSALSEGWGLYAERLAAESGWYDDDLEGRVGQLDGELFRARRLVVDTGLHAKRWTRQQAIDYGIEASEVERYVINPGQACAYMLGELKILELREKARTALKDRFSMKAFHNAVLTTGTVPLDVLEQQIDAYIRSTSGKS
jgi:uncharacterized protein (DUF885 family)